MELNADLVGAQLDIRNGRGRYVSLEPEQAALGTMTFRCRDEDRSDAGFQEENVLDRLAGRCNEGSPWHGDMGQIPGDQLVVLRGQKAQQLVAHCRLRESRHVRFPLLGQEHDISQPFMPFQ